MDDQSKHEVWVIALSTLAAVPVVTGLGLYCREWDRRLVGWAGGDFSSR
jgi:hypothetical protein